MFRCPVVVGKSIAVFIFKHRNVGHKQHAQPTELIAFYERRGYRRTGVSKTFPVNPELWMPKVADLRLEILEKVL